MCQIHDIKRAIEFLQKMTRAIKPLTVSNTMHQSHLRSPDDGIVMLVHILGYLYFVLLSAHLVMFHLPASWQLLSDTVCLLVFQIGAIVAFSLSIFYRLAKITIGRPAYSWRHFETMSMITGLCCSTTPIAYMVLRESYFYFFSFFLILSATGIQVLFKNFGLQESKVTSSVITLTYPIFGVLILLPATYAALWDVGIDKHMAVAFVCYSAVCLIWICLSDFNVSTRFLPFKRVVDIAVQICFVGGAVYFCHYIWDAFGMDF
jgi:predicted membrane channel-forming protein YqfA (hemolysin III family)